MGGTSKTNRLFHPWRLLPYLVAFAGMTLHRMAAMRAWLDGRWGNHLSDGDRGQGEERVRFFSLSVTAESATVAGGSCVVQDPAGGQWHAPNPGSVGAAGVRVGR